MIKAKKEEEPMRRLTRHGSSEGRTESDGVSATDGEKAQSRKEERRESTVIPVFSFPAIIPSVFLSEHPDFP